MFKLSSQNEEILNRAVANGHFHSREEALTEALRLLLEETEAAEADDAQLLPPEEWIHEFRKWARSRKTRNPNLDDSRESIYGDRGL